MIVAICAFRAFICCWPVKATIIFNVLLPMHLPSFKWHTIFHPFNCQCRRFLSKPNGFIIAVALTDLWQLFQTDVKPVRQSVLTVIIGFDSHYSPQFQCDQPQITRNIIWTLFLKLELLLRLFKYLVWTWVWSTTLPLPPLFIWKQTTMKNVL